MHAAYQCNRHPVCVCSLRGGQPGLALGTIHGWRVLHMVQMIPQADKKVSVRAIARPKEDTDMSESAHQEELSSQNHETGPPTKAAVASALSTALPEEQDRPVELHVQGSIPKWLKGSLIRNGPGVFAKEHLHLFDGYAMLVKFEFDNGKVNHQQRFVQSDAFKAYESTGEPQHHEFGYRGSAWRSLKHAVGLAFGSRTSITDNSSVNTCRAPGDEEIVTMTELSYGSFKVSPADLQTLHRVHYSDKVVGDITTAHPVIYPDGKCYNLFTDFGKGRCVAEVDFKTQERKKIAEVPMDNPLSPSWVHDLPGTQNYVIVPDTPVIYSLKALLLGGGRYINFDWDPVAQKTKFHLVNRHTGEVKSVEADFDFMTFHYANAFESEDGRFVYVDCPVFDDPEMLNSWLLDNMRSGEKSMAETPATYSRISIPLGGDKATVRALVPKEQCDYIELPRINPDFKFKDYLYVYGVTNRLPTALSNALSKLDVKSGTSKQWFEPGCLTTEPLMIPRPGSVEEDDGVVTSLVTGGDGKSFLLVLDASTFQEIARAQLAHGVTLGFHNQFYS